MLKDSGNLKILLIIINVIDKDCHEKFGKENPKALLCFYLGLNLCFQLQIYDSLVLKLTIKVCVWEWRYLRHFIQYSVSDTIIYRHHFNLNFSKEHLELLTFTLHMKKEHQSWQIPRAETVFLCSSKMYSRLTTDWVLQAFWTMLLSK